ncbi:DNA alkylation repair protein [Thioclava indica]|uniref:DNA alkylation repair protein n=1 Tax=Thioclava indica TaxID=1353528 RepID=A0A074K168_9RHOB|nr:hypothetical protein DT23_00625 [Thioclava indica]
MSRKRGKRGIARPRAEDFVPLPPEEEARLRAEAEAYAASTAEYESFAEPEDGSEPLGPPPSLEDAIFALESWQDAGKAAQMAQYHKAERHYLGITNAAIDDMVALWRGQLDVDGRVDLARGLWDTNIHEARIAAAKLLVQARLRPDQAAWDLIAEWVEQLDAWAIADQVCKAGEKRLVADPARLDQVETWTQSENLWARRSAFVITQPWTKQRSPKPEDLAVRERVLGWAEALAADRDWFIQNAIAFWLRDLSKKDPERVRAWLETSGETLKTFARKEASKFL